MLDARYDAKREAEIYRLWLDGDAFTPTGVGETRSIVMPPPNVTGVLHMGHAIDNSTQDALARYWRLRGFDTLWLPGTDHAGIATQVRVEKEILKEGITRQEMGREAFVERVWAWKELSQEMILSQLRAIGAGPDWQRLRFTLDEGLSRAVRTAFVRLYDKGLVYRGNYMIHWCPSCSTALSDIEVEYKELDGGLYHLRYDLVDGTGSVTVATTRPETMLGDTAVAVHPEDARYRGMVGKMLRHPLTGREIPVIADEAADPEFGTGAVKVTPAHDPADFDMGVRHGLEQIRVIGEDGRMTEAAMDFQGLTREEARERVAEALEREGVLLTREAYRHSVGHCDRCGTVIEPLVSRQWFVRMRTLADAAKAAVEDGRIRIWPERFRKVYTDWMDNIRDWCVSRQLWWGHRIPAWQCAGCGELQVAVEEPEACPNCGGELRQEEDVLDTWFSSGLWPFSTMGWPDETRDLSRYYPTTALVTGYDILFFWVARMAILGIEMTGEVPFENVVLHGLVRDKLGRKESKSLGNGVDPMDYVREYGADALRYALLTGNTPGQDLRLYPERAIEGRNFANKLWNAARFVLAQEPSRTAEPADDDVDRWLRARRDRAIQEATDAMERFELGEAARVVQEFIWGVYCDWYLEIAKPRLQDPVERPGVGRVLLDTLEDALRLIHPFLPFVSEAIWQEIPGHSPLLARSSWPTAGAVDRAAELRVDRLLETVRMARNLRAELGVPKSQAAPLLLRIDDADERRWLHGRMGLLRSLAQVDGELLGSDAPPPRGALSARLQGIEAYLPAEGQVDVAAERVRVEREIDELAQEIERQSARLARPNFRERAPEEIVRQEEERLAALSDRMERAKARGRVLSEL